MASLAATRGSSRRSRARLSTKCRSRARWPARTWRAPPPRAGPTWAAGSRRPARATSGSCSQVVARGPWCFTSFERQELRRARGANPRARVLHGLARERELADEMPEHVGLDVDFLVLLAGVHREALADHEREDDDVATVRPEDLLAPFLDALVEFFLLVGGAAGKRAPESRRQ